MDAHHAHAHNSCRPDAALYSSPPLWRDSPRLPEEEWGTQAHRCWGIAMSSDLQVPFQTRKPGARRYTNFIVRYHYILAPGRETVRETSKSCVSRSNRESWEACFIHEEAHTNVRFLSCDGHQLYELGVGLEVEGVRYIEMHRGPSAYVLGPPPSRSRDLELEGGVIACHVEYVYEPQDSHVRGTE